MRYDTKGKVTKVGQAYIPRSENGHGISYEDAPVPAPTIALRDVAREPSPNAARTDGAGAVDAEHPLRETGLAIVGLGYVGLPIALALAHRITSSHGIPVRGFDISTSRVDELRRGIDRTREVLSRDLLRTKLRVTTDPANLAGCSFFIVTVPTPIDGNRCPDLRPLVAACRAIGAVLRPNSVVVFESTVYPGVTRDVCGPILAEASGLRPSKDFKLGYSPERINPGDHEHRLESIVKIVAAEDEETLDRVAEVYNVVVDAGLHRAPSIEVAEAAKVIENTQRDLNIALMNELAVIFERLDIPTRDVLAAARTKWNFLPFTPGLVGGHCISVDPYYLTARAEAAGYYPQVVLAGRRINDGMGPIIAQRLVKMLVAAERPVKHARVGILGLAFKENVPDLRNSRVPDIVGELRSFGVDVLVVDPLIDPEEARREYHFDLATLDACQDLDGVVLAVPHRVLTEAGAGLFSIVRPGGVFLDVKSAIDRAAVPSHVSYWSL